ncbi:putative endonuclease 4 [Ktedonobacter sp. SOSP1-52]|uniref:deoxyribonuclease IV n=1 Tax=Ktedonobacter sp. SOSP1-52 TaxID=2778366 RepID=UPI001914E33E|nr:deoxyribonuclease IV [Ktedonobacter sp. SOSP1-52]GHO69342.1 putative endonuclease 4 [Ktedonobacter sp. SOSP1-52]
MRIGRHMPTGSKPLKAIETARQIGCQAIQVFASNPTGWKLPVLDEKSGQAFAMAAREQELNPIVLHAPYLINLGTLDATIWEKSILLLAGTLQRGAQLGASYVVFHTGSHRGAGVPTGLARIAQGIERVMDQSPAKVMLLLENDVGAGNALGHSFEHLATVLAHLPQYSQRLGVCLDTAHLWGAGHDISTPQAAQQVLQHFDDTVGLARLKVLHLNDTAMALGSHRDVHTRLGEGIIHPTGLRALLTDPRLSHVDVLMETPIETDEDGKEDWVHDAGQIAYAKSLCLPEKRC